MSHSSVGLAATRTTVIIITMVTLIIIIAVMVSVSVTAPKHPAGTGQIFDLFLQRIVDFVEMIDAGTRTFESKFSKIVHVVK